MTPQQLHVITCGLNWKVWRLPRTLEVDQQVETFTGVAVQAKCSICGEPTDTLLCLRGGGKWLTGVLMELGVPSSDARYMISNLLDCEPSEVFNHQEYEDLPLLVCPSCVARSGKFPPPEPAGIPNPTVLSQPSDW